MVDRENIAHEGLRIPAITFFLLETPYVVDEIVDALGPDGSRPSATRFSGRETC
jgi:hypothetical protein